MGATGQRFQGRNSPPTLDERKALLQRVAWSREFEKSERLRSFLFYVCERALQNPPLETHEQEIGCAVFGREADYDTSQDNIVRVTASQARKKLERFFASEGAAEPVILEIPKGQYTPVFRVREPEPLTASVPPATQPEARPSASPRLVWILAASCAVLAALAAAFGVQWWALKRTGRSEATPALDALWSRMIPAQGRLEIVVPDSSFGYFQQLLNRQLTLAEYLDPNSWTKALPAGRGDNAFVESQARQRFTSIASVTMAYRIARLAGKDPSRISIRSPRDFGVRQMKEENVVLLGSTRANPWGELIDDRLAFHFVFDQRTRLPYFENRRPQPGQPAQYRSDLDVSYCDIAFLPNLGGTGSILAIAGTEVEGTEAGSEFVTDDSSLARLWKFAKPDARGRFPYFEVLLKATKVGGAAKSITIADFRLLR